jgi:hypothetical protein
MFHMSFSTAYFLLALGLAVNRFRCKVAWHIISVFPVSFFRRRSPKRYTYLNKNKTDNFGDILHVCAGVAALNHICGLHTFADMPVTIELHTLMTEPQPKRCLDIMVRRAVILNLCETAGR